MRGRKLSGLCCSSAGQVFALRRALRTFKPCSGPAALLRQHRLPHADFTNFNLELGLHLCRSTDSSRADGILATLRDRIASLSIARNGGRAGFRADLDRSRLDIDGNGLDYGTDDKSD